jgi:hypothetical protein
MSTLEARFGSAEISTEEGAVRISTWVKKAREREPFARLIANSTPPFLPNRLSQAWAFGSEQNPEDARLLVPPGRLAENGLVYAHLDQEVVALEVDNGSVAWRKACTVTPRECVVHDDHLYVYLDHDVVALDAQSGTELWRLRLEQEELLDLAAGHGKVWLLLRLRGGQTAPASLRALDAFSGDVVHETALNGIYLGTLSTSPGYVLIRGRERDRPVVCCDALTGALMGSSMAFRSDAYQSFLTPDDLVIQVLGTPGRNEPVRVVGKEPATLKERWSFDAGRGNFNGLAELPGHFVFEMVVSVGGVRTPGGSTTTAGRRLIVLDLNRGTARLVANLDKEFCSGGGSIAGDRLYCNLRVTPRTGSGIAAERVRAFDLDKGTSPWATTDFTGVNLSLTTYPTAEWLLLRKCLTGRSSQASDSSKLYFIDQRTGTVEDLIDLGPTRYLAGDPGLIVRDRTLVIAVGSQIRGLKR